jgi:non-homologous end joining protein Ku
MCQQARGAIAKLMMRGKEKLVLIRPTDKDRLLLEVLSYADEVRALEEITVGEVALSDMEVQLAE